MGESAELTTQGISAKAWIRKENDLYLYKIGRREVPASQILDALGIEHVNYYVVEGEELKEVASDDKQEQIELWNEKVVKSAEYRTSHKIVILLTDGAPSQQGLDGRPYGEAISANEQADAIKQLGAEIYTINYDISSSGSISVSTSRNSQGQYEGSASTDDNGNKSFIITPSQYDSTIGVDNRLGLQFWRYGSNSTDWYASADDFISAAQMQRAGSLPLTYVAVFSKFSQTVFEHTDSFPYSCCTVLFTVTVLCPAMCCLIGSRA